MKNSIVLVCDKELFGNEWGRAEEKSRRERNDALFLLVAFLRAANREKEKSEQKIEFGDCASPAIHMVSVQGLKITEYL